RHGRCPLDDDRCAAVPPGRPARPPHPSAGPRAVPVVAAAAACMDGRARHPAAARRTVPRLVGARAWPGSGIVSSAREEILARVRRANRVVTSDPEVVRGYRREGVLDAASVLDLLEERLVDYRATVHRDDDVPRA